MYQRNLIFLRIRSFDTLLLYMESLCATNQRSASNNDNINGLDFVIEKN